MFTLNLSIPLSQHQRDIIKDSLDFPSDYGPGLTQQEVNLASTVHQVTELYSADTGNARYPTHRDLINATALSLHRGAFRMDGYEAILHTASYLSSILNEEYHRWALSDIVGAARLDAEYYRDRKPCKPTESFYNALWEFGDSSTFSDLLWAGLVYRDQAPYDPEKFFRERAEAREMLANRPNAGSMI